MLKEVVRLDVNQVGGMRPNVLPIVNDAHHVITARKQRPANLNPLQTPLFLRAARISLQIRLLACRIETLVPRQHPVGEEPPVAVQYRGDLVRIVPGAERADVELEKWRDVGQELVRPGAQSRVVP